jgi:phospholipid/cholesterol/gamma-HCH transport system permease protein
MQAAEADQHHADDKSGTKSGNTPAAFATRTHAGVFETELSGNWLTGHTLPSFAELRTAFEKNRQPRWRVVAADDLQWDSQCMARLYQCALYCEEQGEEQDIEFDIEGLPEGMQKLLRVATAVKSQAAAPPSRRSLSQRLAAAFTAVSDNVVDFLAFTGELSLALMNLLRGRANIRLRDFFYFVQQCGPQAIGIVALISVLVGMILAYLGSVQLRQFGAELYVANLVAIGMMREMGALMTAVIMAGRTGAAYAAQLGAMQANEEIDAITTLGISPMEYLVLPRFLSLLLVMPLLCVFADALGLLGGALVAGGMDVNLNAFFHQAREAVHFDDIAAGLIKSVVFAALIAIAGCQAGLQSGRSSAAVGEATTRAVVNAIVYLVIADAGLNILYDKIGF